MQKIICLHQGSGTVWDEFNQLLADGWVIKEMQAAGGNAGAYCFVWIEKKDPNKPLPF